MANPLPAAAWFDDPTDPSLLRWWNGEQWTDHTRTKSPSSDPAVTLAQRQLRAVKVRKPAEIFSTGQAPDLSSSSQRYTELRSNLTPQFQQMMYACWGVGGLIALWAVVSTYLMFSNNALGATEGFLELRIAAVVLGSLIAAAPSITLHLRANDAFSQEWATTRGFTEVNDRQLENRHRLRLLSAGDDRRVSKLWSGKLLDQPALVGEYHYLYEVGDEKRTQVFTVLSMHLPFSVAQRFPGISTRAATGIFGKKPHDKVDGRKLETESRSFNEMCAVTVDERQDEVAFRELFGPQFIVALEDLPVQWDQRGSHILFFIPLLLFDDNEPLDRFLVACMYVYESYLREFQ